MATERRVNPRTKLSAETSLIDATGTSHHGKLRDIGRGGIFIATEAPVLVGKLVEVKVTVGDEVLATSGRVIWVRAESKGDHAPAGVGLKFIDVDEASLAIIDRFIGLKKNVRERTILGIAAPTAAPDPIAAASPTEAPSQVRERTILGVGTPAAATPPPAANVRERTVLGIGVPVVAETRIETAPTPPPREPELSWPDEPPVAPDAPVLVVAPATIESAKEPAVEAPPAEAAAPEPSPAPPAIASEPPPKPAPAKPEAAATVVSAQAAREASEVSVAGVPKQGSKLWLVVVLVAVGAAGVYFLRDRLFPAEPAPIASIATPSVLDAAPPPDASPPSVDDAAAVALTDLDASGARDGNMDAGLDSSANDAGKDGGHDAGKDAGQDGGKHAGLPPPKPKPSAKPATTSDEPY